MKRVLFRIGAVFAAILVAALVAEVGMRIAGYTPRYYNPFGMFHEEHAALGHMGRPNFEGRFARKGVFDVYVKHDGHGFRAASVRNDPAACDRTLYVVGDSFTWGFGVDHGEVFTDELSRRLPKTHVRNLGLSAAGTLQQLWIFREFALPKLRRRDVVLITFFANDFSNNVSGRLVARVEKGRVVGTEVRPPSGWLKRKWRDRSYLLNFLDYASKRFRKRDWSPMEQEPVSATEKTIVRHCLKEFRRACSERGARLLLAVIPHGPERGAADVAIEECCRAEKVEMLDLRPHFDRAREAGAGPFHIPRDCHWNAAGHALAGRVLAAHLAR